MIRYQPSFHGSPIGATLCGVLMGCLSLFAQDSSLERQVTAIREVMVKNKAALSEYTWQEQETIAVKDKVWRQQRFQAQFGPDGNVQRIALGLPEESSSAEKANRRLREWMAQNKEHAMQTYAQEVKQLAETYTQADTDLLRLAYERGDVASGASGTGAMRLLVHNYLKPGDSVTLLFDLKSKELQSLEISSYLANAKEAVLIGAKYSKLRDGPNHIDEIRVVAKKRNLSVSIRNLDYQRLSSSISP